MVVRQSLYSSFFLIQGTEDVFANVPGESFRTPGPPNPGQPYAQVPASQAAVGGNLSQRETMAVEFWGQGVSIVPEQREAQGWQGEDMGGTVWANGESRPEVFLSG